MSDYLLYWKYFWEDIAENPHALNEEWHTEQKGFWYKAKEGDNLWVVISGGKDFPNEWRLLQKIVVQEKFYNQFDGRRYELKGNPTVSERYEVSSQSDLTDILQKLEFESGKKIQVRGKAIGNTLQAIRPLNEKDGEILKEYARNLERHSTDVGSNGNLSKPFFENSSTFTSKTGAGFGSPEMNRKVEESAISIVTDWYKTEGWSVESVESMKCGYDLLCRKNSEENHVEVKGVQGDLISFIITAGEVRQSQNDNDFVLCVVTSALTDSPKITLFDNESFASDFDLSPISYRATLRK